MALRAVEDDDAQARIQILALFAHRQIGDKGWKLMGSSDMQLRFCHLGARGCTQAVAAHQGGDEFRQVGNRRVHRARRAHLAALVMFLRLALIVPPVGQIGGEIVTPYQARAGHAQPVENGLGQIADVESQALRLAAVLDDELQQDETFARIAVARAGIEMDAQLLVGFDEPEVAEAGRMGQAHPRRDLFPARIVGQILIGPVLVREHWIGAIARQRLVEIVLERRVEVQLALIDQLHHRVCKHRLGERRAVHDGVGGQRIAFGVTDAVGVDIADLAAIDHRNGHALGMGAGHDLAHFGVDGGAAGYRLCDGREREGRSWRIAPPTEVEPFSSFSSCKSVRDG